MNISQTQESRTLIVGIGSSHGDDRAGWLVAEQLRDFADNNLIGLQIAKSPVDLLDWVEDIDRLVICDACHGLAGVGELHRWLWPAPEISEVAMSGTHNLSLPNVLNLAEKLGRLPERVVVWVLDGAASQPNAAMSPEVIDAIPKIVGRIVNELNEVNSLKAKAKACTNNR